MSRLTLMLVAQVSFYLQAPQEVTPRYVCPIFQDHLNVMCHMMMLNMDQKTESPIKSAKNLEFQ